MIAAVITPLGWFTVGTLFKNRWTRLTCVSLSKLPQRSRSGRTVRAVLVCIRRHTASLVLGRLLRQPQPSRTQFCQVTDAGILEHQDAARRQTIMHSMTNSSPAWHTAQSLLRVTFVFFKWTAGRWLLPAAVIEADFHRSCGSIPRAISLPNGKPITAI